MVTWTPFCLNVLGMRRRFLLQIVCGWINKHKHSISNVSFFVLYQWMNSGNFYGSEIRHGIFFPGGGTPLFGLYGYVPLNRVRFSRFWVLNWVYNFTIERLELGVFLDWKPFKECEDLGWAVCICNTNNFFLNICFHDFSVKNYLILYAKQANHGQKVVFPVLNRVAK